MSGPRHGCPGRPTYKTLKITVEVVLLPVPPGSPEGLGEITPTGRSVPPLVAKGPLRPKRRPERGQRRHKPNRRGPGPDKTRSGARTRKHRTATYSTAPHRQRGVGVPVFASKHTPSASTFPSSSPERTRAPLRDLNLLQFCVHVW